MKSKGELSMASIVRRNQGIFLKENKAQKFMEEKPNKSVWEKISKQSNEFRQKGNSVK